MWYPVKLKSDTNDTILVTFPDIPEAVTHGEDRMDALARAIDALETAIQGRIADKEDIPKPSRGHKYGVKLPTQAVVKILLYNTMRDKKVSKARLARNLHCHRPQVDRLLDLKHASRLDHIDAALQSLGTYLEVGAAPATRLRKVEPRQHKAG